MVNLNEEQIARLKTQADQFGGVDSQQFKDKVNTQYGDGSYDKLVKNVASSIQSGAIQGNMENANKIIPTQAPVQTPTQPVGIQAQVNTPTLPAPTPIQEVQTKTEVPVTPTKTETTQAPVKIESIEQFKQKGANLPNLEQFIEDRYGSTATQEDGGVTSVINGEKFKWTIDSQGNPIKTSMGKVQQDMSAMDNADTLYTSLLAGQVIPETLKTSNNYVKAQNRFNQYNQFKNLNQSQYQQLLAQGKLVPGTQAYNDLMNDPIAKANIIKAQNLNAINQNQKAEEKIVNTEKNQSKMILSNNPTVSQALEDGSLSVEEYQSLTNTPDIAEKTKNVSQLKEDYIRLKSAYEAVEDDVLEEFKGKGKSGSYLKAKISANRDKIRKELSLSEQLYTSAMGELTTMKNDATALLNTNLQLYKEQQSRQQQLEDRQYQEDLATRKMQQEYDYTYGDINSTDPRIQNTAIQKAVQSMYEKYPIPGLESQSIKVQKIKDRIAQGMSGTQAIQEVENEIRNSNRYKQYLASEQAKMMPQEKATQDWAKLSDGTLYNQRTGETRSVSDVTTGITDGGDEFFDKYSFIKKSEGFREQAYDDATGKVLAPGETPVGTATIGYGFTTLGGKPVKAGDTITREQADGAMVQIADKYSTFKSRIKVPLSDQQEGALLSLEYNLGPGWKEYPAGKKIIEAINKGDFKTAANILATSGMGTTNAKTGEVMQGLVNRRKKEAELLLQGTKTNDLQDEVRGLTIGLGGTEKERAEIQNAIVQKAKSDGISLQEAKKKLKYKTGDDIEFAKTRKEDYQSLKKTISESTGNAKTALTLLNQPQTAINDVASVVGFLKTIDPSSVARESEVESVENARGVIDNLSNTFAKLKEGTKLTDNQRKQLKDAIQTIVNASDIRYNEYVKNLVGEFEERGLDASTYIPKTEVERVLKGLEAKNMTPTQNTGTSNQNTYNDANTTIKDLRKNYFND